MRVASPPELYFTKGGAECCLLSVGVEQWRKEADGEFTQLDPTFRGVVAFEGDGTARETSAPFRKGDSFIASGHIHEYEVETCEGPRAIKEEFVARKIGHNANQTEYVVQRGRHAAPNLSLAPGPAPERPPFAM